MEIRETMRWKFAFTVLAMLVAFATCVFVLTACNGTAEAAGERRFYFDDAGKLDVFTSTYIITDTETGCEYLLVVRSETGIAITRLTGGY